MWQGHCFTVLEETIPTGYAPLEVVCSKELFSYARTRRDLTTPVALSLQQPDELAEPAQWTAAALGLLALPVVAWSEYTLRQTGGRLSPLSFQGVQFWWSPCSRIGKIGS